MMILRKVKDLKKSLSDNKKVATLEMVKNSDYLYLVGNTVVRSWGGNESFMGDKYFKMRKHTFFEVV